MRSGTFRKFLRANRGTAAIEFGIVALPLLTLALGSFEFARLYWTQEALQESATAGARCMGILQTSCASTGAYSSSGTVTYIQQVATAWGVTIPSAGISLTRNTTCGGLTGFSQVQITYTFNTLVPNIVPLGTSGKTLSIQSCYPDNS
jgi:Flp pilus assembly protein TadG